MVKYEKITFCGLEDTVRVYNETAELLVPTKLGIRILSYKLAGGENLFKLVEEHIKNKDADKWQSFGGHRLWAAPEEHPRTYEIDGAPIKYETGADGLHLTQSVDKLSNIKKELHIKLDERSSAVRLTHRLTNHNNWPVELAAWPLTVFKEHGFCAVELPDAFKALLPDRALVLWPYARMNDPRVYWGDKIISVRQDPAAKGPFKLGLFAHKGAAVYVNGNYIFKKKFGADADKKYPDFGCNFECYTNPDIIECESLSPLKILKGGETLEWSETWVLTKTSKVFAPDDEPAVLSLLK